ncbi:hypothetical protein JAAARDRAFT_35117 [Jaapia argillacea MUCL 33604]|uniref:MYND-type domain-containing protein n=1 Tax=Jaapia argillacea MUCL 33604 TaxID=933084 RepID=A0A067PRF8_9AGAM|nr:hypothetical protein JAAARDRAFT_35117 [Jaapia argillacea MUCL 33604]
MDPLGRIRGPPIDVDAFMASSTAGIASMRSHLDEKNAEARLIKVHCSYCKKESDSGKLKICSHCKSVRYCDRTCQAAHYKARHKKDCAAFADPPFTRAFVTHPMDGRKYPETPIFGKNSVNGVGCWVSIGGVMNCSLRSLIEPMDTATRLPTGQTAEDMRIMKEWKAGSKNLITLSSLVQNRRKDGKPILVWAGGVKAMPSQPGAPLLLAGRTKKDVVHTHPIRTENEGPGILHVLEVAHDPWAKAPRVRVNHINGKPVSKNSDDEFKQAIRDPSAGIITLNLGEFVIFEVQFRCGDNSRITKDFDVFDCLWATDVPIVSPWDPSSQTKTKDLCTLFPSPTKFPNSLIVQFDQDAIQTYYTDYIYGSEEKYVRSHFGDARANMMEEMSKGIESYGKWMIDMMKENGNYGELMRRLRDSGQGEMIESLNQMSNGENLGTWRE